MGEPRIALLSHRGGNIGHDFMALGWEVILRAHYGTSLSIEHFEQHRPFEVYPDHHPLRLLNGVPHGRLGTLRRLINARQVSRPLWLTTRKLDFHIAIACGGPNIIPGASRIPEMGLMCHHMTGAFGRQGIPVLDTAVGSCFPYETAPSLTDPADLDFYKRMIHRTTATTVRDEVAQTVLKEFGRVAQLIPCASVAAGRSFESLRHDRRETLLINYQLYGANEDWGQDVDPIRWRDTLRDVIRRFRDRYKVLLLCHNEIERDLASNLDPSLPRIMPRTLRDYGSIMATTAVALVSRLHAAIPLAGFGVPSLVVGTDTRMQSAQLLGLPTLYVKDATADVIEDVLTGLLRTTDDQTTHLLDVRESTIVRYRDVLEEYASA